MTEGLPKSQWGAGPWQGEPDALDWRDAATGYACAIRRNSDIGSLCGYVGVAPGHALHGWRCDDSLLLRDEFEKGDGKFGILDLFVYAASGAHARGTIPLGLALKAHGGVNWSGAMPDGSGGGAWWFGFDCAHSGDYAPGLHATLKRLHIMEDTTRSFAEMEKHLGLGAPMPWGEANTYRTVDYVKAECATLALQLAELEKIALIPAFELNRKPLA
jgi:hypothetical protein